MNCKNKLLSKTTYLLSKYACITLFSCLTLSAFSQIGVNKDLNSSETSFTLVLDAGHGGKDSGCLGKHSQEKDIALAITKMVGNALQKDNKNLRLIYTRDKDVFIPLHKRSAIANETKADLFISIHCNAVKNPNVHGSETYVMGLHKAEENLAVAKRENESIYLESDYKTKYQGYDPNSPIGHILLSTYQNIHLEKSIELASLVEDGLEKTCKHSRGVKQAGFVVLREATMPSVLIETGFLTNAKDEALLKSIKGQKEIAQKIAKAINKMMAKMSENRRLLELTLDSSSDNTVDVAGDFEIKDKVIKTEYKLQLAALSAEPSDQALENFEIFPHLEVINKNGISKVLVGSFENLERAISYQNSMRARGYKDAFLVKM